MTDSRTPQISAKPQPLTVTPIDGYPSALVDDPVYLVDDSNILVGSQAVVSKDIRIEASTNAPDLTGDSLDFKTETYTDSPSASIEQLR